ncbi:MAG: hypothetical protein JWN43_2296 [Gammaproteobacteria bacterium]|nr:hypothetical protein [Gammaproteobacteria bacterium]
MAGETILGWNWSAARRSEQDSGAALEAARVKLPLVLSYKAATVDQDLLRAREQIAQEFVGKFHDLANRLILPATKAANIHTTATIARAGLASVAPGRVVLLVYINQSTQTKAEPSPRASASEALVTMTESNGQWLIAEIRPV